MSIVTGDYYLSRLVNFVERQMGPLLEGTVVLKLNPVGLHYILSRLEQLEELERLLTTAPVDYLRAYISDLGDHRALEQLRRIFRLLTSLKIVSVLPPPARDPTPLSLTPFCNLKSLELRGCDLSTSAAKGLHELRSTLEKLICHNSTDALKHVFAGRIIGIKDAPQWMKLTFVSCACNGLVSMDESLQLLPSVETLNLSCNQFAKVDNLKKCTKLKHLDLSFNHLRTITFSEVLCPVVELVLRSNALTSLHGIENLKSIEGLDLSYNIISRFAELEILAGLPFLRRLWLEGNPICCERWYKAHVFSFFPDPKRLKLDGRGISRRESWQRHVILAGKQKRPASYGIYSPAGRNGGERNSDVKKKKIYRLACIQDEQIQCTAHEKPDQASDSSTFLRTVSTSGMDEFISSESKQKIISHPENSLVGIFKSLGTIGAVGCSYSSHAGSPPHYEADILHRCHDIDDEFTSLSVESFSAASSDSDTSCYGDYDTSTIGDSCSDICNMMNAEDNSEICESHGDFVVEDKIGKREESSGGANGMFLSDFCLQNTSDQGCILINNNLLESTNCCEQDLGFAETIRKKAKRRIVSLAESECADTDAALVLPKLNSDQEAG